MQRPPLVGATSSGDTAGHTAGHAHFARHQIHWDAAASTARRRTGDPVFLVPLDADDRADGLELTVITDDGRGRP